MAQPTAAGMSDNDGRRGDDALVTWLHRQRDERAGRQHVDIRRLALEHALTLHGASAAPSEIIATARVFEEYLKAPVE